MSIGLRPKPKRGFNIRDRRPIAPIAGGAPVKRWSDMTEEERAQVLKDCTKGSR